jgi:PIN domain nuclease of toxin-antitoxin system
MSIKMSIGKLSLHGIDINSIPKLLYECGVELIVLDPFEAVALHRLPPMQNHRDPFDRMLICQAIARNLTLVSADEKITQYREHGLSLIW